MQKELPDAFLRRCIFHYIAFPDKEMMEKIINVHFDKVEENLLNEALEIFYMIRGLRDIQKKPSTSEIIDWIQALQIGGTNPESIKEKMPFVGVLLKKSEDLEVIENAKSRGFSSSRW